MSNRSLISEVRAVEFGLAPISPVILGTLLRVTDLAVIGMLGLFIYFLYVHSWDASEQSGYLSQYLTTILVALLIASALFQWMGVYAGDHLFSKRLNTDRTLSAWAVTCCALLLIAFSLKISDFYSRVWALSWFLSSFALLALGRVVLAEWIGRLARDGRFAKRTVILGAGDLGQRLASYLNEEGDPRTRVIGFVDDRQDRVPAEAEGYALLGDCTQLIHLIRQDRVDQVILALPWQAEFRLQELIRRLALTPVELRLAPDMIGFGLHDRSFTQVAGLPMLHVLERPISGWSHVIKTIEDRVLASLALLFLAPLFLLIALAIKLDSPGPVFFIQQRQGFNGKQIWVRKFRTMYHHMTDHDASIATTRDDHRVTNVGRFLRRTSLDELPQFINVLAGEMSLVGPRPHALNTMADGQNLEEVVEAYAARHKVKPGITGWAQINGWRGELDSIEKIRKRVEYDLYYIDRWSVWFDLKIIARTLLLILRDENAF